MYALLACLIVAAWGLTLFAFQMTAIFDPRRLAFAVRLFAVQLIAGH